MHLEFQHIEILVLMDSPFCIMTMIECNGERLKRPKKELQAELYSFLGTWFIVTISGKYSKLIIMCHNYNSNVKEEKFIISCPQEQLRNLYTQALGA